MEVDIILSLGKASQTEGPRGLAFSNHVDRHEICSGICVGVVRTEVGFVAESSRRFRDLRTSYCVPCGSKVERRENTSPTQHETPISLLTG